ncbi:MAG: ribonuclease P protein component [Bacteroidota bacterium]
MPVVAKDAKSCRSVTKNATSANSQDPHRPEADSGSNIRHTFSKIEKLCAKRSFDYLFKRRRSFNAGRLWVVYYVDLPEELVTFPMMVAMTVPKRTFKRAVHRNLLKRRMREAYRLNKHRTLQVYSEKGKNVAFLIKYNTKEIRSFKEIEKDMRKALRRLAELI